MRLEIRLLGPFQTDLDGIPVTGFESSKVRALLAYLAAESRRPHMREALAGLLWPDWPNQSAMSNLRYALADLRKNIGDRNAQPPFLLISRESIQLNLESDCWIDVLDFEHSLSQPQPTIDQLQATVQLYRGDFLENFSLADSPPYEEWVLTKREYFRRQALKALHNLADLSLQTGDYEQALAYAYGQVELEPYQEEAHRQVMRLLALQGQRSAALAQFEKCRQALRDELGVEPTEETSQLYEQIRSGKLTSPAKPPEFLRREASRQEQKPIFVARQNELVRLDNALLRALQGKGQVILVTGGPGRGKTALLQEFSLRAQSAHPDLAVAIGNCQDYFSKGDPYIPFREILEMFTGDVEDLWATGKITQDHATRLWRLIPQTTKVIVEEGPALVDTFIPGSPLLKRASQGTIGEPVWLTRLQEIVRYHQMNPYGSAAGQEGLFSQYSHVLRAIARQTPLLVILDDLQWADTSTLSLLFILGRQISGTRILIAGAYRREEAQPETGSSRSPIIALSHELQLLHGDILINLADTEDQGFVETYLDSQPNRLGKNFREMLIRRTHGHPLYTIELLRGMQERGELFKNANGEWEASPTLDWETLPPRVEAAIGERLDRLAQPLRDLLQIASIEGERFTAEVIAQVQQIPEQVVLRYLSNELDRQHYLVRAEGMEIVGGQRLARFHFRHTLFQRYLYKTLDPVMRAHLHQQVGEAMEKLYGEQPGEVAAQLARHFEEAYIPVKAIVYLSQAGERAAAISGNSEAVDYFNRALELTPSTDQAGRFKLLLRRQQIYHKTGQVEAAEQDIRELESIAWQLGSLQQAQAALRRAHLGELTGQVDIMEAAQSAIASAQAAGETSIEAEGYYWFAYAKGDEQVMQKALNLARQAGLKSLEADILRNWASLKIDNDSEKSISLSQQAIDIYRSLGNRYGEGRALASIGFALQHLDEPSRALPYHAQSLEICREVGNRFDELWALLGIWIDYQFLGCRLVEIPDIFLNTIPLAQEFKYTQLEGKINSLVAEAYRLLGEGKQAIPYSERAINLSEGMEDLYSTRQQLKCHADILADVGLFDQAEQAYQESLQQYREKGQLGFINWNLISLGRLALRRGQANLALSYIEQVLENPAKLEKSHFRHYYLHWDHLTCYQVLHANDDPRADQVLAEAYQTLQESAARIEDQTLRRSFLENLPWNREIVRLWQSRQG